MGSKTTEDYLAAHMSSAPPEAVERMREFLAGRCDGRPLGTASEWKAALAGIQAMVRAPAPAEAVSSPDQTGAPPVDRNAELALVREWMGTGAGHAGRVFFGGESRPPV